MKLGSLPATEKKKSGLKLGKKKELIPEHELEILAGANHGVVIMIVFRSKVG